MISDEEAMEMLEQVGEENLRKHMMAVGTIMEKMAEKFSEDKEIWKMTGLLHDIDYKKSDMNEHGLLSAKMLEGKLPEEALHAVRAHNERTGVKAETLIDKALIAADAASGLVVATALVMPGKKLSEVKTKSLIHKFKDKSFAKNIDRGRILVCDKIGMDTREFLSLALEAMNGISDELGL
ncbi:MAG: HDIG domain-containing protein [Candidatus Thermoplasmatota archaeon]|nr:HDIG domain-containing protein [Candidatus Thermoplasmatota archaeon]